MKGPTYNTDASLGLSFSQMRHNKIMARKKVPRKSYEREFQKFSGVRPFTFYTFYSVGFVLLFMLHFPLAAAPPLRLVLINATHSRTFLVLQQLFCQPH